MEISNCCIDTTIDDVVELVVICVKRLQNLQGIRELFCAS
jgi:hypothetical protein